MSERPIGMQEMGLVFEVVDQLEISRERIRVELLPSGSGAVARHADGRLGITLPADRELSSWQSELERKLTELRLPEDQNGDT